MSARARSSADARRDGMQHCRGCETFEGVRGVTKTAHARWLRDWNRRHASCRALAGSARKET